MRLTFDQAERVGLALHDHVINRDPLLPPQRDDLGWADIVQFVLRAARDVVDLDASADRDSS